MDSGGPIYNQNLADLDRISVTAALGESLGGLAVMYLEFSLENVASDVAALRALNSLGYTCEKRDTSVIKLAVDADKIWASFSGRARNMIRKAEKNGVVIERYCGDDLSLSCYLNLVKNTFKRQSSRLLHPETFFEQFALGSLSNESFNFFLAKKDGSLIGGSMFLIDGSRMIYISGATDTVGKSLAANSLLIWSAIKAAKEKRLEYFDLGGHGRDGIDRFKSSFGGEKISRQRYVKVNRLMRLLMPLIKMMVSVKILKIHR